MKNVKHFLSLLLLCLLGFVPAQAQSYEKGVLYHLSLPAKGLVVTLDAQASPAHTSW